MISMTVLRDNAFGLVLGRELFVGIAPYPRFFDFATHFTCEPWELKDEIDEKKDYWQRIMDNDNREGLHPFNIYCPSCSP